MIKNHFGDDLDMNSIILDYQEIQVDSFGYDLYDGSDYIDYLIITKTN